MLHRPVRINKGLLALATLAAVFLLGTPQTARANINIYLQEDAGSIFLVGTGADFTSATFTGTFGPGGVGGTDFSVTIEGGSSTNNATLSDLLNSTNAIQNTSSATHTLHVWVSQANYTLPAGTPLSVESGLGGSVNNGTLTLANIYQAYADKNNNQLGTPAAGPAITDFTNGPQTAAANGSTFDTGSAVGAFSRTGNFSLTSVANIALTAGSKINFSAHVNVTGPGTVIPEPSTMALAGLGSLGLIGYALRRRRSLGA
jgi:hypothetical protein